MPSTLTSPGRLVSLRGREWVVLPSDDADTLLLKPLGGSEEEITGIYLPLGFPEDEPSEAEFPRPSREDLGTFSSARLLLESARLAFRNGAGPFRCLAKLSFRPRAYQMVPLIMALRHEPVRLLVADDVGVGKTVEALLIVRELLERRIIRRFAVLCLPHLCDQWQEEMRAKVGIEAVVIRSNTQARLDREIQGDTSQTQPPSLAQAMQVFASMLCAVEALAEKVDGMSAQLEKLCARSRHPQSVSENGKREKEFFTVKEVAEIIGTSDKSVRRLQKRGFFRSSKALRTKQIPRSEIDRYKLETV